MNFSSVIFVLFFLPIFFLGYYLLNKRFRNAWLIIASLIFLAFGGIDGFLFIIALLVINYVLGKFFYANNPPLFWVLLIVDIGSLVVFKYLGFLLESYASLVSFWGIKLEYTPHNYRIPIGLSFVVFQLLSFIIDIKKGIIKEYPPFSSFIIYTLMFPQLVSGPIIRFLDVESSLKERTVSTDDIYFGICRFIKGLSKKVILANTLALIVQWSWNNLFVENMLISWIGAMGYTLQIYFDFSGYSDMALGLGRMIGFTYPENFNYPYTARSLKEFWNRWHITLSTWFRDYVYIPLGGNRRGKYRTFVNSAVVFLLTGIWHGAAWNFIIWGCWHGFFIICEKAFLSKLLMRIPKVFQQIYLMFVVTIGWVFFASDSVGRAIVYLKNMFSLQFDCMEETLLFFDMKKMIIFIVSLIFIRKRKSFGEITNNAICYCMNTAIMLILFLVCLIFMAGSSFNPFIYFKF